jgi:hypothetical protein
MHPIQCPTMEEPVPQTSGEQSDKAFNNTHPYSLFHDTWKSVFTVSSALYQGIRSVFNAVILTLTFFSDSVKTRVPVTLSQYLSVIFSRDLDAGCIKLVACQSCYRISYDLNKPGN